MVKIKNRRMRIPPGERTIAYEGDRESNCVLFGVWAEDIADAFGEEAVNAVGGVADGGVNDGIAVSGVVDVGADGGFGDGDGGVNDVVSAVDVESAGGAVSAVDGALDVSAVALSDVLSDGSLNGAVSAVLKVVLPYDYGTEASSAAGSATALVGNYASGSAAGSDCIGAGKTAVPIALIPVGKDGGYFIWKWVITAEIALVSGCIPVQLSLICGDSVMNSEIGYFYAGESLGLKEYEAGSAELSAIEALLAEIGEVSAEAVRAGKSAKESAVNAEESAENALESYKSALLCSSAAQGYAENAQRYAEQAKESEGVISAVIENAGRIADRAELGAERSEESAKRAEAVLGEVSGTAEAVRGDMQSAKASAKLAGECLSGAEKALGDCADYAESARLSAELAEAKANLSAAHAQNSQYYARKSELGYEELAVRISEVGHSAESVKAYADNAKVSEGNAKVSEENAAGSAESAKLAEGNAKVYSDGAKVSENNAKLSEENAVQSAQSAESSALEAQRYAEQAKSYAGTGSGGSSGSGSGSGGGNAVDLDGYVRFDDAASEESFGVVKVKSSASLESGIVIDGNGFLQLAEPAAEAIESKIPFPFAVPVSQIDNAVMSAVHKEMSDGYRPEDFAVGDSFIGDKSHLPASYGAVKGYIDGRTVTGRTAEVSFKWTDFEYEASEYCTVEGDNIAVSSWGDVVKIKCAGEVLGFTVSSTGACSVKIDGGYVLQGETADGFVIAPVKIEDGIEFYGSAVMINFTDMRKVITEEISVSDAAEQLFADTEKLFGKTDKLGTEIERLSAEQEDLEVGVGALEGRAKALEADVGALESKTEALDEGLSNMNASIYGAKAEIREEIDAKLGDYVRFADTASYDKSGAVKVMGRGTFGCYTSAVSISGGYLGIEAVPTASIIAKAEVGGCGELPVLAEGIPVMVRNSTHSEMSGDYDETAFAPPYFPNGAHPENLPVSYRAVKGYIDGEIAGLMGEMESKIPVKGIDYFTADDINEIAEAVYLKIEDGNGVRY